LSAAIDSALQQTIRPLEVIVVDDGSTDGTGNYIRKRYGTLVKYVWQSHQERSAARNLGISLAKGDYICFLDSDDVLLPIFLEKTISVLKQKTYINVVGGGYQIIERTGNPTGAMGGHIGPLKDIGFQDLLVKIGLLGGSGVLVRRSIFSVVGGFDQRFWLSEDWHMWLRVALATSNSNPLSLLGLPLTQVRLHDNNNVQDVRSMMADREVIDDVIKLAESQHYQKLAIIRQQALERWLLRTIDYAVNAHYRNHNIWLFYKYAWKVGLLAKPINFQIFLQGVGTRLFKAPLKISVR